MSQGLRNCAPAQPRISILLKCVFPDGYWHGMGGSGTPRGLWLVSLKLKPMFPHAKLIGRPALREGGKDYKRISPHLSSAFLRPPPHHQNKKNKKRRGLDVRHVKAFKMKSSGFLKKSNPQNLKPTQMDQNGDTMYPLCPHHTHPN